MSKRITIDPISRIEGHLRVDVEVNNGAVSNSWSSCTMWRGIENILRGRDPREAWVFTQRFCGVCTTVHAMASVRSVEDALKMELPLNAQLIRNLILINHSLHDHIVHFYHLSALDYVDVTAIPKANPAAVTALIEQFSDWPGNSKKTMEAAQKKVLAVVQSGQLGIFTNGYWGHPAMKLSPEVNLLAFAHYVQALEYQRKANQVVAMLGSKTPHIQNLAVGGVQNAINLDSMGALNMDRLESMKLLMGEVKNFVQQVYFVDACAIAAFYSDWFNYGRGVNNYLAACDLPLDGKATKFDLPGGSLIDGQLKKFDVWAPEELRKAVTEDVTHAYYKGEPKHPWKGETDPDFTDFQENGKYSWVKAPRYNGKPVEVGPLAQVLIGYAQGHELTRKWTDKALATVSLLAKKPITLNHLHSTMGRQLARAIRAAMLTELADKHWTALVNNIASGDTKVYTVPEFKGEAEGVGVHEAPRGLLSHWIVTDGQKIKNYQAVVPSTWNASPRDKNGVHGPYEASLIGNPVADPEKPLEVLRTIHSFDPCLACACHTFDPEGKQVAKVKVL